MRRRAPARWLVAPLVPLALALGVAGCAASSPAPDDELSPPFADCSGLLEEAAPAAPSAGSAASPAGSAAPADVTESNGLGLPDVTLPCFTGGAEVSLAAVPGPAVVNIWGSWCGPCREELPLMQELADATAGRLHVLGVDTYDSRDAGASFAAEHGVSMPTLYDRDKKLLNSLGKANLPITLFVDGAGKQYVYTGKALDKPALGELVLTHTGVRVGG